MKKNIMPKASGASFCTFNSRFLAESAMICALYIIFTQISHSLGLANNAIQIRFSEALTVLPFFTPAAIPGLFAGCLLSNLFTGCALPDIIFGSLTTFVAALLSYFLRSHRRLIMIPPILLNTLVIPQVLLYAYGLEPLWFHTITVAIGEIISCGILGTLLLRALDRYRHQIFPPR